MNARPLILPVLATALGALALSASTALAAPPETPEAKPVTAITAKTATLNGVLNPGGKSEGGSFQFSYAPTTEPLDVECGGGGLAPLSPALSVGAAKEAVSAPAAELQPNHEYAVCVTAFSLLAEPSERSGAVSFTTLPFKPEIASEVASGVSSTAATLEAQVNANNETTEYAFEYSTKEKAGKLEAPIVKVPGAVPLEGFPAQTASVPTAVLLPGTTYFYRVVAENAQSKKEGKAVAFPVQSFTTLSAPKTEPVTAVTATTATFNGTLTPLNASGEPRYSFDYNQGSEDCTGASTTTPTEPTGGTVSTAVTDLQPGATYSVCLVSSNAFGSEVDPTTPQVSFKTLAGPPSIESEMSSSITPEGATLETTVNPNNQESTCSFEYSTEEAKVEKGEGTQVSCSASLGAGGSPVTGTAALTGLELHKQYFYRALAENTVHEKVTDSTIEHFETEATIAPALEALEATDITANTANLTATIDPNNASTVYHVEYDTTAFEEGKPGHGISIPGTKALTGATALKISIPLSGLSANVEYHWRLVASNTAGMVMSVDHTFIYDSVLPGLPDGRQYELVTPPQKNGALIGGAFGGLSAWAPRIAKDGDDVIAPSIQCFAEAQSCTGVRLKEGEAYEFARTSDGWVTHALAPPASEQEINTLWGADADTHATLFSAPSPPLAQDDFYVRQGQEAPADIGPVGERIQGGTQDAFKHVAAIAATSDFSHVLYQATDIWSLSGSLESSSLYEYAPGVSEQPLLVGVTGPEHSIALVSTCNTEIGGGGSNATDRLYGSLSADGRTAYFSSGCPGEQDQLYARVDGESSEAHTETISAPTAAACKTVECQSAPVQAAVFAGASNDGSRVYFTSTRQMTDKASQGEGEAGEHCDSAAASGCNLYESVCAEPCGHQGDEPASAARELVDVSEASEHTQVPGGPRVQGVMAISSDGSHVYFVAHGVLTKASNAQGQEAEDGANNLYMYERDQMHPAGRLAFIAKLPPADESEFSGGKLLFEWTHGIGLANVTPDGRFLVFLSHGALTPDDTRPEGPAQVYRYDSQSETLVRISVGQNGFNDNGNAGSGEAGIATAEDEYEFFGAGAARSDPTMSDDGDYVFFESPVALTSGALNDVEVGGSPGYTLAENVYEYHEGNVSLISDGKDVTPNSSVPGIVTTVRLLGSDASGTNAFFATSDELTAQDTDTQRDYYDARICTPTEPCFTPPSASPAACSEEACHTPPSTPPVFGVPGGTATFAGESNIPPATETSQAPAKPKTAAQIKAEKLAKALKVCKKDKKSKRNKCEKQAKRQFGPAKTAKKASHDRRSR